MKTIRIILLILLSFPSVAQLTFDLKGTANEKISSSIPEGADVQFSEIAKDDRGFIKAVISHNDEIEFVNLNQLKNITFTPSNSKEFWQHQALNYSVYENITKNGLQYGLRNELEQDAIEYLNYIEDNRLVFRDSYLESYLYSMVYKIYPSQLEDGRPGILNVKILKQIVPNAFVFPNGTLVITTGLLSTLNSEEELLGVLAHEVSHFVLDHSIANINAAVQRQKRAEFWAGLATGLAAAADAYIASNNSYYSPGALTMGTAVLAYSIANTVNERLGLKYSRQQEIDADLSAVELLKFINVEPTALSSALSKIKKYNISTGNYLALSGGGTHPDINSRIERIGLPTGEFNNLDYDKKISFVNSFNSINEFNSKHLTSCKDLVLRNILANVATEDDLVLLAMTTIYMFDNDKKNNEALDLLRKAENLKVSPSINIPKQKAIVLLRLNKKNEAKKSLELYLEGIKQELQNLENIKNTSYWTSLYSYLNNEYDWTSKMIYKIDKL